MAFQKALLTEHGIDLPEAYFKVLGIAAKGNQRELGIQIAVYKDADAAAAGKAPLGVMVIKAPDSFENGIKTAAYNFLKTLPQFADSTDV